MQTIGTILALKVKPSLNRSLEAAVILAKANQCGNGQWLATRYRHHVLTLTTASAIQAQELVLKKDQILRSINELLGQEEVKRLIFRSR